MRRCPSCGTVFPDEVAFCGMDGTITLQQQDPTDVDPRIGQQLGTYLCVARIADGAMGRVYEGRHVESKARVAIKVLHADVAKDQVSVERFRRESDTAKEVAHPNVVQVIDFGETPDKSHFMTMEYLQGEELGQLLRREGAIGFDRIVRIICQAALALDHAHSFGVIHRDLKPDNIFLVQGPEGDIVKLLDFGSVKLQMETGPKLTAFGTTLGSPFYMSPEQAMGKSDVDQRTDVFAISAILHEMLTGKIAFEGASVAQILMKIVNENPDPPSSLSPRVPPALDDVVEKGVRKDKTRRYASVGALAEAAVRGFGLASGKVEEWARTPQAAIGAQLVGATPPPPKPFGVQSVFPPANPGTPNVGPLVGRGGAIPQTRAPQVQQQTAYGGSAMETEYSPVKQGPPIILFVAIGGVVFLGFACVVIAWLL